MVLAAGYGVKIYVSRGHLIVEDGVGRQRETRRYHRATSNLKRLVIVGHDGYITLEAMRWLRDIGAAFSQIDTDGTLIALSAPARHHESSLRRAQVLAADSAAGKTAIVELLRAKIRAQAEIADRLTAFKATVRVRGGAPVPVSDALRAHAGTLTPDLDFARLRQIESMAGLIYWKTWARVPVHFDAELRPRVPDHWHLAGVRTSKAENKKRARKATTPVHAMLNYTYAILETEATIAAHKLGFDPSLGIMHADRRYRSSLATDLMEPARPAADAAVLSLLETRSLQRGDVIETREGVCRIGRPLARILASQALDLRAAVAPHAEQLARDLLRSPDHPTPLTRRRHAAAIAR